MHLVSLVIGGPHPRFGRETQWGRGRGEQRTEGARYVVHPESDSANGSAGQEEEKEEDDL